MTRPCHLDELTPPARINNPSTISPRLVCWRLVVLAAVHDQHWHGGEWRGRRCSKEHVAIDVARQRRRGRKIVKPADEHGADDAGRRQVFFCRQERGKVSP